MKRIRRRISSILMTAVMVISMLGGLGVTAQAEGSIITEISVTIESPLIGNSDLSVKFTVPEGANYTVTPDSNWEFGNMVEQAPITEGSIYGASFKVTPKEGYTLDLAASVIVNGSTENVTLLGGVESPASIFEYTTMSECLGTIDTVELNGIPQGNIGETAAPYSQAGTNYTASGRWIIYDRATESWKDIDGTHTFAQGNMYAFHLAVEPSVGYVFGDEAILILDGAQADNFDTSSGWRGSYSKTVSHTTEITEVNIASDAIPTATVGQSYDGSRISIKVPDGSNYTAYGIWHDEAGNVLTTAFEDGKAYSLGIYVVPNAGYSMAEKVNTVIGEYKNSSANAAPDYLFHSTEISFKQQIDKIVINNVPKAVVGEDIKKGENGSNIFAVEVPSDANYIAEAGWYLSNDMSIPEGKFENGKSYDLYIMASPKEGYEFSDDVIFVIDGVSQVNDGSGKDWANALVIYSFCNIIEKVEVTGVKMPVVGEAPVTDTLKLPSDANYVLALAEWVEDDTNQLVTKFENGHAYRLELKFEPKEGYEFEQYPEIIVDGEDYSDMGYSLAHELYVAVGHTSFEELLPEVRFDNVPEMKIGEKAAANITVPSDANYEIKYACWEVWNEKDKNYEEFAGVFEVGKTYRLYAFIEPEAGYRFDKASTVVYVNGVVDTETIAYEDGATLRKYYSADLKEIHRIELTVAKPVVGAHSSIPPQVTVPEGANYSVGADIDGYYWMKDMEYNYYHGYFNNSDSYGACLDVYADEGYKFADDLVVVVNGIVVSQDDLDIDDKWTEIVYFFGDQCNHSYGVWSDAKDGTHVKSCTVCGHKATEKHVYTDATGTKCSVCGAAKNDVSPKTGDSSNMLNAFALMAMCGIGVFVLDKRKKKSN